LQKKIVIADSLGLFAIRVFNETQLSTNRFTIDLPLVLFSDIPRIFSWLAAICFTLQIYYDFSAYSDMAIGLGRIFGVSF